MASSDDLAAVLYSPNRLVPVNSMKKLLLTSVAFASLAFGCGGSDECGTDEVEVTYLGTSNDRVECHPIPSECNGLGECEVNACISAMFGLCESPAFGVGCSDTFAPTIISCNE